MSVADDKQAVPGRDEIRAVVQKYFTGADDSHVSLIESRLQHVLGSASARNAEDQTYYANSELFHGRAWREELSYGQRAPRPIDLVAWIAANTPGFPAARPYCPDPFIGQWEAADGRWELRIDGAFASTSPDLAQHKAWFLVRRSEHPFRGDHLNVKKGKYDDPRIFVVAEITPVDMKLDVYGRAGNRITLRRIS